MMTIEENKKKKEAGTASSAGLQMLEDSSSPQVDESVASIETQGDIESQGQPDLEALARDILDSIEPLPPPSRHSSRGSAPGAFFADSTGREREACRLPFGLLTSNANARRNTTTSAIDSSRQQRHQQQSETEDTTTGRQEEEGTVLPAGANESLAVANRIEDGPMNLPQAQEFDPESNIAASSGSKATTNAASTDRSHVFCFILIALGLVTIIVVTLAITLSKREQLAPTFEGEDVILDVPTTPNNTSRTQASTASSPILDLLPSHTVQLIQQSESSAQAKAFDWILNDPFLEDYSNDRIIQRFVLALLYFSSGGPDWLDRTNWMSYHHHECTWYSQTSFAMRDLFSMAMPGYLEDFRWYGDQPCNATYDKDLYQNLWLDQNNLMGTIPTELYLLTSLKTLSLGLNGLQGTISTHVGQLTNLEGLAYFYLMAGGTIPSQIGLLTNLRGIGLGSNGHSGSIPTEFSLLTDLSTYFIAGNQLSGSLPELQQYSQLKWVNLDENGLTGTIPQGMGQLEKLEFAAFGGNLLSGTVPTELGLLTNVLMLSFYSNQLTGKLPSELGELTACTLLSFRANMLSGPIPTELGLVTNLTAVNLQQNSFTGRIPSQLGNLGSLYELSLMENKLTGKLPSELGLLSSLGRFSAQKNSLTGTIPQEMTALLSSGLLYTFDVASTSLSGTVPQAFCGLNGTCLSSSLNPCEDRQGLTFDCSGILCGCDCPCPDHSNNTYISNRTKI